MEEENKEYIKLRLATCFRLILKKKKGIAIRNKAKNIEDLRLVESLRQLESESGLSYTIIQRTFTGKRDIQFTSLMKMIESLGLTFTEFAKQFDKITEDQIRQTEVEIAKGMREEKK